MAALLRASDPIRHIAPTAGRIGDTPHLEIALLRRGIGGRHAKLESCGRCSRHLLVGEQVYEYSSGRILCTLCAAHEQGDPEGSRPVRTAAFGSSIRLLGSRGRQAA